MTEEEILQREEEVLKRERDLNSLIASINAKIGRFEEGKKDIIKFLRKTADRTEDSKTQSRIEELINHFEIGTGLSIL